MTDADVCSICGKPSRNFICDACLPVLEAENARNRLERESRKERFPGDLSRRRNNGKKWDSSGSDSDLGKGCTLVVLLGFGAIVLGAFLGYWSMVA